MTRINKASCRLLIVMLAASLAIVLTLGGTFAMSTVMEKTNEFVGYTQAPEKPDPPVTPPPPDKTAVPDPRPPEGPKTGLADDVIPWFAVMVLSAFLLRKVVIKIERKRYIKCKTES